MYKVGIIGAESYHSEQFAKLINEKKLIDAKVTHLWAEPNQQERAEYIKNTYGIETLCESYEEMIGKVDVAFIVTRNGANHFEQAKPFMDANIPLWIDKPIALNSEDVNSLCEYADKHGAKLLGGSTLKDSAEMEELKNKLSAFETLGYFSLSYCSSVGNPNGGISFYSIHMTELAYYLFGDDNLESLSVSCNDKTVVALFNYRGGLTLSLAMASGAYQLTYAAAGCNEYAAGCMTCSDCYSRALEHVVEVIEGKRSALTKEEFTIPVKLMELVEEASETPGKIIYYNK